MRVYVCIQNSGSLKVKETELVETEKKKKNTSRPNGLWTKHIQTRKIYECRSLHISCLFKNTATRRTGHDARIAVRICVCPTRKKKERGEIVRRLSTISKHTNNLRQEWYCSNSCFGKHPAVEGGGKWKKKNLIKFISGSLASQLVSWTAAVVKSPRWPRQARSRINKSILLKLFHGILSYWSWGRIIRKKLTVTEAKSSRLNKGNPWVLSHQLKGQL